MGRTSIEMAFACKMTHFASRMHVAAHVRVCARRACVRRMQREGPNLFTVRVVRAHRASRIMREESSRNLRQFH